MIRKIQAKNITLKGQYAPIPNELIDRKDLSIQARFIWIYLMSQEANWKSSRNNLARNLGIGPNQVSKALRELEAANMLRVDRTHRMNWNFDLIDPENWENPGSKRIRLVTKLDPIGSGTGSKRIHIQEDNNKNKNGFVANRTVVLPFLPSPPAYGGGGSGRVVRSRIGEEDKQLLAAFEVHFKEQLEAMSVSTA